MIIWLASYPRSGNTMFRMALNHLYDIDTYSVYADQDLIGMGAAGVVGHIRERIDVRTLARDACPHFVKTHDSNPGVSSRDFKAIHIVRDGRDVLTSYAYYRVKVNGRQVTPSQSLTELLTTDAHIWGGWSGHARGWLDWPGQRILVKYEDMLNDVHKAVDKALTALCIPQLSVVDGVMPKFGRLSNKWPQFFRKGQAGSWEGFMNKQQLQIFWARHGAMMEELGYV